MVLITILKITETDRVSTFTGLDDYDTLFAARHGRGALDPVPRASEQMITTSLGISPHLAGPELINPMEKVIPNHDVAHSSQKEQVSLTNETLKPRVVSPSSEIIGESAAIFTDMMKTILNVLDQQVAMSPGSQQQTKGLSSDDNQTKVTKSKDQKLLFRKKAILIYFYLLWKITG